jgi:hypothetical protein
MVGSGRAAWLRVHCRTRVSPGERNDVILVFPYAARSACTPLLMQTLPLLRETHFIPQLMRHLHVVQGVARDTLG